MCVKRLWIPSVLCVLVMVIASSSVSATPDVHNFGTATAEFDDINVEVVVPDIGEEWTFYLFLWEDKYAEQHSPLDVEVTCEFMEDYTGAALFCFLFNLSIEWWDGDPPQLVQDLGYDNWQVSDTSANYNNQQVYDETLSMEIEWMESANGYFQCRLEVSLSVPGVGSDVDWVEWKIYCEEYEPPY